MRILSALFTIAGCAGVALAEVHTLTLKQAVGIALDQNPDLAIARLEEQKAQLGVKIARDPFVPKLFAGSGLAYTYGFPQSIDGAAPSIVQARGVMSVFNKPQSYQLEQARENASGAPVETARRRDEIAFRTASLFLEAEDLGRSVELQRKQLESLDRMRDMTGERVKLGRELAIEEKKGALEVARAKQRITAMEADRDNFELSLANVLGYNSGDRVRPAREERQKSLEMPGPEEQAIASAWASSHELKQLESQMRAKSLEAKSHLAQRLPKLDLVAQYALFGKFNRFEDYFNRFQTNNAQIGVSVTLPILVGPAAKAYAAQAELEVTKLRAQMNQAKSRIATAIRQSYQSAAKAESVREFAKLDLEVSRDQLAIVLARYEAGRATIKELEEARVAESEKWIAFYQAVSAVERAKLGALKETGTLIAALQ